MDSPNISRKMVPATTTEVSAGIKYTDLKNSVFLIHLLFSMAAKSMGNGISKTRVPVMYLKLFQIAFLKILSVTSLE